MQQREDSSKLGFWRRLFRRSNHNNGSEDTLPSAGRFQGPLRQDLPPSIPFLPSHPSQTPLLSHVMQVPSSALQASQNGSPGNPKHTLAAHGKFYEQPRVSQHDIRPPFPDERPRIEALPNDYRPRGAGILAARNAKPSPSHQVLLPRKEAFQRPSPWIDSPVQSPISRPSSGRPDIRPELSQTTSVAVPPPLWGRYEPTAQAQLDAAQLERLDRETDPVGLRWSGTNVAETFLPYPGAHRRISSLIPVSPIQGAQYYDSAYDPDTSWRPSAAVNHADDIFFLTPAQERLSVQLPAQTIIALESFDPHSPSPSSLQSSPTVLLNNGYRLERIESDDGSADEEIIREDYEISRGNDQSSPSGSSTRSIPMPAAREELLQIDHNSRYAGVSDPPFWYIKDPIVAPLGDPKHLCATCRRINLTHLYSQRSSDTLLPASEYIRLGTLVEFIAKIQDCGLCHFVMRLIAREVATKSLGTDFTLEEMAEEFFGNYMRVEANRWEHYSLFPTQFETRYNEYALFLCRGHPPDPSAFADARLAHPGQLLGFREVHSCCRRPNTGRVVHKKESVDTEWITGLLQACDERSVGRQGFDYPMVNIRVIDVHRMCVVALEPGDRYVTLSYVWGEAKQVRMIWETKSLLQRENGLLAFWELIPKTIRDAVTLTREIGEDYLWVDALCIIQDDPIDQATQIKLMGSIYLSSVLTIIAACGDSAAYGLPGVDPGSRNLPQMLGLAGNSLLCNVLSYDDDDGKSSVWDTRAWTMQENVLSQRKLIITDSYYKFWCQHTSTPEDVHCRHSIWPVGDRFQTFFFFNDDHSDFIPSRTNKSNLHTYASLVSDYTRRNMKKQDDAENAIAGVFDLIKGMFAGDFLYGLPDSDFAFALLWCPIGPSKRRINEATGHPLFPAWSWLGWIGPVAYHWAEEQSFSLSTKGCNVRWRDVRRNDLVEFSTTDFRPPNPSWSRAVGGRHSTPHPHRLAIRTMVASFRLSSVHLQRPEPYNTSYHIYSMHILDSNGFRVGSIYIPSPISFSPVQAGMFRNKDIMHEFIVLSRASIHSDSSVGLDDINEESWSEIQKSSGSLASDRSADPQDLSSIHAKGMFDTRVYDENAPYCMFNVMMIEWDKKSEVAFRAAVGRIHVDAFNAARPSSRLIHLE